MLVLVSIPELAGRGYSWVDSFGFPLCTEMVFSWFSSLVKNQNLILSYLEIARSAASPVDAAFMLFKHLETVSKR